MGSSGSLLKRAGGDVANDSYTSAAQAFLFGLCLFGLAQTDGDDGVATWRLYCLYITD